MILCINGTSKVTQGEYDNINLLLIICFLLLCLIHRIIGGSRPVGLGVVSFILAIYDRVSSDEEVRQNYLSTKERFA